MRYEKLDFLKEKVLIALHTQYKSTDSTVYTDNGTKTLATGDMLGDLTDELKGKTISSFVSTGPKSCSFE